MTRASASEIMKKLEDAIGRVYYNTHQTLSFEQLYRGAYDLVLNKYGDLLYEGISRTISKYLSSKGKVLVELPDDGLLTTLAKTWVEHKTTSKVIQDIVMYMDRNYVKSHKKDDTKTMGHKIFRDTIVNREMIGDRVKQILLDMVASERNGNIIDRDLIRSILTMLNDLGIDGVNIYNMKFEDAFMVQTREFYQRESASFLANNSCSEYLLLAERRLQEERDRVSNYLCSSTKKKLEDVLVEELILQHYQQLVSYTKDKIVKNSNSNESLKSTTVTNNTMKSKDITDHEASSSSNANNNRNYGLESMLKDDKHDDIRRMYQLFRDPSTKDDAPVDLMLDCIQSFCRRRGMEIVLDSDKVKDPNAFVSDTLDLKRKFDVIVERCLPGEKKATRKIKDAFEDFLNKDTRGANYLAQYLDELLRIGLKGVASDEVEMRIDDAICIFQYLHDKDVFESFYRRLLSKRLLGKKSISEDIERTIIAKFRAECGYQYASKLEGMFSDMKISQIKMSEFKQFQIDNGIQTVKHNSHASSNSNSNSNSHTSNSIEIETSSDTAVLITNSSDNNNNSNSISNSSISSSGRQIDFYVDTLTTGFWPFPSTEECILPVEMRDMREQFESFYHARHNGRKLVWLYSNGSAEVKFNPKTITNNTRTDINTSRIFTVSVYQAIILMLFNDCSVDKEELSLQDLRIGSAIPETELRRHLLSMCTPKLKLLLKSSKSKGIQDDDSFKVNAAFSTKYRKIKMPLLSMKEQVSEKNGTNHTKIPDNVEEDRSFMVDAAIVRVMKARRTATHNDLIGEVTHQLNNRFIPNTVLIKKRIEHLIEREFIERDETENRTFHYIA